MREARQKNTHHALSHGSLASLALSLPWLPLHWLFCLLRASFSHHVQLGSYSLAYSLPLAPQSVCPHPLKPTGRRDVTCCFARSALLLSSGCVTSVEAVLIGQQSVEKLHRIFRTGPLRATVFTASLQSLASLAVHFLPYCRASFLCRGRAASHSSSSPSKPGG